jgi:hypothetical protein
MKVAGAIAPLSRRIARRGREPADRLVTAARPRQPQPQEARRHAPPIGKPAPTGARLESRRRRRYF